tara:strand:+ start:801 stop:1997 length:1197 start_codon:yes stop_codon:yes gene_type:complete
MSFGGDDPQVIETGGGVYEPAEPYVKDIMSEAARLYASDVGKSYYPGSTVIPFAPETQAGLDLSKGLGFEMTGPSRLYGTAETALGGFATGVMPDAYMNRGLGAGMGLSGGMGSAYTGRSGLGLGDAYTGRQAYGELAPQADYLRDVRAGISSNVMGDIASQFGGMGRTGTSPAAQQAAARGFTQAYAPIAQSAAEAERARELSAREADIVRQQQARSGALSRTQQALQADIARQQQGQESALQRMYGGTESQLQRQYGASQADIARQQQARESGIARMMQGAQALPGLQQQMDERRLAGISGISGVGSAYEDLAARNLQDRINRFQFEQQAPYQRLSQFASPIFGAAGMQMPGIRYAEQANPLTSAFGLAEAGYGLGSQFGYGGLGAILGGLGGLLG